MRALCISSIIGISMMFSGGWFSVILATPSFVSQMIREYSLDMEQIP
jgi:hypothetical protein